MTHPAAPRTTSYGISPGGPSATNVEQVIATFLPANLRTYSDAHRRACPDTLPQTTSVPVLKTDPTSWPRAAQEAHVALDTFRQLSPRVSHRVTVDHEYNIHHGFKISWWHRVWETIILPGVAELNAGRDPAAQLLPVPILTASIFRSGAGLMSSFMITGAPELGWDCYDPHMIAPASAFAANVGKPFILAEIGASLSNPRVHADAEKAAAMRYMLGRVAAGPGHCSLIDWFDGAQNHIDPVRDTESVTTWRHVCTTGQLP